jgi:hypothetical protein
VWREFKEWNKDEKYAGDAFFEKKASPAPPFKSFCKRREAAALFAENRQTCRATFDVPPKTSKYALRARADAKTRLGARYFPENARHRTSLTVAVYGKL